MKWIIENMMLLESALSSLWYLVFVASSIVLILVGIDTEFGFALVLGAVGILIILFNETLKALKTLRKKGGSID